MPGGAAFRGRAVLGVAVPAAGAGASILSVAAAHGFANGAAGRPGTLRDGFDPIKPSLGHVTKQAVFVINRHKGDFLFS